MHELSVTAGLLESVEEHARRLGAQRVRAINLVIGERSGLADDSLRFYFDLLAPGTLVEGASLNVRRSPMRFHCTGCAGDYSPVGADFDCPTCATVGQVADDGSGLIIESMEIEE